MNESSRAGAPPVKGWKRHIDGWQAGVVAVVIAGTAALLGVPRAVPPADLPDPSVHALDLEAAIRADEERARPLLPAGPGKEPARTLDHDVRRLGEAVRAFGRAESEGDVAALERARGRALEGARAAIARSPDEVLALRAYQTHTFLRGMEAFARTGEAAADLLELAGTFPRAAEAYRWYDRPGRRLLPDEAALRAMYKKRWNELTGLTGTSFALALDEERALLRFLIAHPAVASPPPPAGAGPDAERARALADTVAANEKRLAKIRELAKLDPTYPAAFAEGVVLFRLGRFEPSAVAFERHLAAHPDGPWTLRARNHLKAALEAR